MFLSSDKFKFDQGWWVALVCLLGAVLIWGVAQVSTAKSYLQEFAQDTHYLVDDKNEYTVNQILELPDLAWQVESNELLSYGMTNYPYWFRFSLPSNPENQKRLLEIDYALLDEVDLWFFENGQLLREFHEGDKYPFADRTILHEKLLFPVPASQSEILVVIKAKTTGTLKLPIFLWEEEAYLVYNGEHNVVMGLFFGFMSAMALSNLFFFITTRNTTFLSYCGYVGFLALTLATLHGLGYKYLWPESVWLQGRSVGLYATVTIFCALIFSRQILDVKHNSLILDRVLLVSSAIMLFALLLGLLIPYAVYIKLFLVLLSLAVVIIYGVGVALWYKGVRLARFYLVAWTALLVTAFITSLDNANLIELDVPSHYLLMFGATVETFLLALALAISYSQQRDELFASQALSLEQERQAREAQEKLLKLREEAQHDLEYKVQERTLELEIALRELSETNRELEQKNLTDGLTGIRNRQYFDKKYLAEVRRSRREHTCLSVVMIDIDHFKKVNDTYGHTTGDKCIRVVARVLRETLRRPSDDICRYGGEEFALILPNTDEEGARLVAESMRENVENTEIDTDHGPLKLTLSAGVCSSIVLTAEDEKNLLEKADEALYVAKQQGRNRVAVGHLQSQSTQTRKTGPDLAINSQPEDSDSIEKN